MRTPLLGVLALLCGAEVADAQAWPAYTANQNAPGYGPSAATASGGSSAAPGYYYYYYLVAPQPGARPVPTSAPGSPYSQATVVTPGAPIPMETANVAPPSGPPDAAAPADPGQPASPPDQKEPTADPLPALLQGDENPSEGPQKTRVWAGVGYTGAWISRERLPTALVTSGPPTALSPGALGAPTTVVLFGDHVDFGLMSGVEAEVGGFLDDTRCWSLEWDGQFLPQEQMLFRAQSNGEGLPVLARPIFNVITGKEAVVLTAAPGFSSGSTAVEVRSEYFKNEINARYHLDLVEGVRADALVGFKFLRLAESLSVLDQLQPLSPLLTFEGTPVSFGSTLADLDSFRTTNHFYGPQVGGQICWDGCGFCANAYAQVAIGGTSQEVDINGLTTVTGPGGGVGAAGGILALSSNIGNHTRTVFGVVPEMGANVGFLVCPHVSVMLGWSSLLWNAVVRPGNAIDRFVNPNLIPSSSTFGQGGPARPGFVFSDQSLWVNSFNCGVGVHY